MKTNKYFVEITFPTSKLALDNTRQYGNSIVYISCDLTGEENGAELYTRIIEQAKDQVYQGTNASPAEMIIKNIWLIDSQTKYHEESTLHITK